MLPGKDITDGSHPRPVLKHRFSAAIKNPRVHIRVDHRVASGVAHVSAQHIAARSFRAGDVAALHGAAAWLGTGIGGVAGSQGHGGELQVCSPCRLRHQQDADKQQ